MFAQKCADLTVREEPGVPGVRILQFHKNSKEMVEIVAETSDLEHIAAVLAGRRRAAGPAKSRSFHDPVLARKYARFQSIVRVLAGAGTTFVFATERGPYVCRFSPERSRALATQFAQVAAAWKAP